MMQTKLASTAHSPRAERANFPVQHPLWRQAFRRMVQDAPRVLGVGWGGVGGVLALYLLLCVHTVGARRGCLTPPPHVLITGHCAPPPSSSNVSMHQRQVWILRTAPDIPPASQLIKMPKHEEQKTCLVQPDFSLVSDGPDTWQEHVGMSCDQCASRVFVPPGACPHRVWLQPRVLSELPCCCCRANRRPCLQSYPPMVSVQAYPS